jgi:hypothetical protein
MWGGCATRGSAAGCDGGPQQRHSLPQAAARLPRRRLRSAIMAATLRAPALAALPARLAAAFGGIALAVPPFTAGVTNATPSYLDISPTGEVRAVGFGEG